MIKFTKSCWRSVALFLAVAGPGLIIMLADTDASSIIVAAQSGAVWGYRLLALQFVLMPILYIAQELTLRLGLVTGMGHGELIKKYFGKKWAWFSVGTLLICCIGAILTEFSGVAGVGQLFGVPTWCSMLLVVIFLLMTAWSGNYLTVERVALFVGLFELVFLIVAYLAHPNIHEILAGLQQVPFQNHQYLYLAAANIGAVIMPWMIFYQQSAVLDKGLGPQHLKSARWDTLIGAVVTQSIMAAVLIVTAATVGKKNPGASLDNIHQISQALTPFLGDTAGRILFALGMLGASLVAAIVVSLTAAWGLGEITGFRRSLQDHPRQAPAFYGIYSLILIFGAVIISLHTSLVSLNVAVNVMNACLLPIVLGFLFLLARKTLPEQYRLKGGYAWFVGIVLGITTIFGVGAGVIGTVMGWG